MSPRRPGPVREPWSAGLAAARSALAPPYWSAWAGVGAVIVLAVTFVDVVLAEHVVLTGMLVLAPLVCAVLGGAGDALAVALLATGVAAVSVVWNGDARGLYAVGLVVVLLGGALAALVAVARAASEVTLGRFRLLAGVAGIADGAAGLERTVTGLLDLLTPRFADVVTLDSRLADAPHRLGARVEGAGAEEAEAALMRRRRAPGGSPGVTSALADGVSQLLDAVPDELLAALAHDAGDLDRLRALELRSAIFVPLRARGQVIGAIGLALRRSARRYTRDDLRFAEVLAGRVALALDNAGLTSDLSAAERQLDAALEGLAEAVTVTATDGRITYVNEAAVALLQARDAEELYRARPGETLARFAVYDERGRPVSLERLPGSRALAGERDPEPLLVRNVVRATGEERWLLNKVTRIEDDRGELVRVVNVIENVTEATRAALSQRLLARAGEVLAGTLDYDDTLQQVAEVAVPELADWCGVDLPGHGVAEPVAVAHVDPERVALARRLRELYEVPLDEAGGIGEVIRTGRSIVAADIPDEALRGYARDARHLELLRAVGLASYMVVPLRAGGQTLGAMTLARSDPVRRFNDSDLALAEELGRRAGTALLNARLYTERTAIAETLQRGLRPPGLPEMPGWRGASLYRPAGEHNEVGGDFYDAFPARDGWMVVVGDVAGQGAAAATLTGLARYTLRTAGQLTGDPALAARQLNDTLRAQPELALVTAVCAHLTREPSGDAVLRVVSCGHPLPILLHGGEVRELGAPGTLAGAFDDETWSASTVALAPGDVLLLYTDGVIDTVGEDGGRFGDERLLDACRLAPAEPAAVVDYLAATLDGFQRGEQSDDTAIVALQLVGAAARAEPGERQQRH